MAASITLYNEPSKFSPAGNPLIFTSYSSDITEDGFKFLAEVYINDTKITTLNKQATEGNYQFFDISRLADNYLTYDFNPDIITPTLGANSVIKYEVKGGYRTDAASGVTSYGTGYTFNGVLDRTVFNAYDGTSIECRPESPYSGTSSTLGNFLTDYKTRNVGTGDRGTLSSYNRLTESQYDNILIITYSESGSIIDLYKMLNTYYTTLDYKQFQLTFPAYPVNMDAAGNDGNYYKWIAGGWSGYTGNVITTAVATYTINFGYSAQQVSNFYTFNIVDKCTPYDQIQMSWMNNWGAFDYLTFNLKNSTIDNFERNEYSKTLGTLTNQNWSYNDTDFETKAFNINNRKEYLINSNWLNDDESSRVIEMVSSPIVYAYIDDEWLPRVVTVENILEQTVNNEKLIQYSISLKSTYKTISQRQ